jgi:hypothetical protein
MQKTIWFYIGIMMLGISMTSCENELDVAADWKETAVVYGLLNPTDAKQYLRIQKTYLDEKIGALAFSTNPDSLYFDSLEVKIDEYNNGNFQNTYNLKKVNGNDIGLPKDDGVFATGVNYLYEMSDPVKASNFFNNYSYVLSVTNPKTGYSITSNTVSVGQAEVSSPVNPFVNEITLRSEDKHSVIARYQEGKYVRTYDMVMNIEIEEVNRADTNIRETKVIQWKMMTGNKTVSLAGYEEERKIVYSAGFFNSLGSQLKEDASIFRRLVGFELNTYGIANDLYTFISVNEPSIGIVQKKPEYTNISNGLGIFSSRYINKFPNGKFKSVTRSHLQLSEATQNLGFVMY